MIFLFRKIIKPPSCILLILLLGLFTNLSGQTITFFLPNISATCNNVVEIPIKVNGFHNILSIQGSLEWDTSKIHFQNISYFGPSNLSLGTGNFGISSSLNGRLSFSWYDRDLSGENLNDSTTLFILRFLIVGSRSQSLVSFTNTPTTFEVINTIFSNIPIQYSNGILDINCNNVDSVLFL